MKRLSDQDYVKKLNEAKAYAEAKQRNDEIKAIKKSNKKRFKFPTTTKILVFIVVLLCIEMIVFGQVMSWRTGDTMNIESYLTIGGTLVTTILGYLAKSLSENKSKYTKNDTKENKEEVIINEDMNNSYLG